MNKHIKMTIALVEGPNKATIHLTPLPKKAKPCPCGEMGDVDGDGWVTMNDANMIAQWVVGNIELSDEQLRRADVNADGEVTIVDAMFIAQYIEGLRDTFPCCE